MNELRKLTGISGTGILWREGLEEGTGETASLRPPDAKWEKGENFLGGTSQVLLVCPPDILGAAPVQTTCAWPSPHPLVSPDLKAVKPVQSAYLMVILSLVAFP